MNLSNSRTSKSLRNITSGIGNKALLSIFAFATRTVFIRLMGAEYTGVNSLYTNIFSVLSLAELGISNVVMYYLYSALSDADELKIKGLVIEFKKIYTIIMVSMLILGLSVVPILQFIVKSSISDSQLITYYLLFLINLVSSYFLVYRIMVLNADQKLFYTNIVSTFTTIGMYVFQLLFLFITKNFIVYLLVQIFFTILQNIILNNIAIRHYPYIKDLSEKSSDYTINKTRLIDDIKATFLFKLSDVMLDQTDSIIISIMIGTVVVGYYSNYYLIIYYFVTLASIVANGLVASYGNLNTEHNMDKSYTMFKSSLLAFSFLGTWFVNIYLCVIQDFIPIWIGKQYVMNYSLVLAILFVFYFRMSTNTVWIYRSTMGLFKEVQYINLLAAILNIALSIIMGKCFGISGIIIATGISRLLTSFWYEAKVIYNKFQKNISRYFLIQLEYLGIMVICTSLSFAICKSLQFNGVIAIIIKIFISTFITIGLEILLNHKKEEFRVIKNRLQMVI